MSDEKLQALYRRLSATRVDAHAVEAVDIADALARSGYPDDEGTALDRIAASSAHADILRTALALAPEAKHLAREIAAARVVRQHVPRRGWVALAAGVGAAAVLIAGLRTTPPGADSMPVDPLASESIMSASFDSDAGAQREMDEAAPIFRGDFDS